jgi:hypothetical protein
MKRWREPPLEAIKGSLPAPSLTHTILEKRKRREDSTF